MTKNRPLFWLLILLMIIFTVITYDVKAETNISELKEFLDTDKTDEHEYLPWYTCGHFSRDLARNATEYNISMGSIILGYHPVLRGYQNHIRNYIIKNGSIWLIEPQNDQFMRLNDTTYRYYRLYLDGTQVPSNWNCNLATELII